MYCYRTWNVMNELTVADLVGEGIEPSPTKSATAIPNASASVPQAGGFYPIQYLIKFLRL